jgi:plasmid stability protein
VATIQIRDIPDDIHEALQKRARAAGQSLQSYMREQVVELERRRTRRDMVLTEMAEILKADGGPGMTVEEILEARDADRR